MLVTLLLMVRPAGACQYDFTLFYDTFATPRADSSVSEPAISNSGDVSFLVRGTIPGTEGEQVPFRWLFRGRVGEPLVAVAVGDQDPSLPHRTNAEGNLAAYFSPIDLSADFLWRDASALLPDVVTVGLDIGLDKTMTYVGPPNGSSVRLIAPMSATSQEILTQTDLMNLGFDLTVTQPWGYSPCLTEDGRLWVSFDGRSGTSGSTRFTAVLKSSDLSTFEVALSGEDFNYNGSSVGEPILYAACSFAEREYYAIDVPFFQVSDSIFRIAPDGTIDTLFGEIFARQPDGTYSPTSEFVHERAQIQRSPLALAVNDAGTAVVVQKDGGVSAVGALAVLIRGFLKKIARFDREHSPPDPAASLFGRHVREIEIGPDAINDHGTIVFKVVFGDDAEGIVLAVPTGNDGDDDGAPDGCDLCAGADDSLDADGDGVPDGCDLCDGDDATGDGDGDGACGDADCDDADPDRAVADLVLSAEEPASASYAACSSVTLAAGFSTGPGAEVTLDAGVEIVFENGSSGGNGLVAALSP